jgi:hypothetical protein
VPCDRSTSAGDNKYNRQSRVDVELLVMQNDGKSLTSAPWHYADHFLHGKKIEGKHWPSFSIIVTFRKDKLCAIVRNNE